MASGESGGVARGETVGRRSGAQQRGASGRENGSDLTSSSSKKKQKDRYNQESREAKRAGAAASAGVDGVLAEVKKGKTYLKNKLCLVNNWVLNRKMSNSTI